MFKKMPKERQLRVSHVHKVFDRGYLIHKKNDVNLKLRRYAI